MTSVHRNEWTVLLGYGWAVRDNPSESVQAPRGHVCMQVCIPSPHFSFFPFPDMAPTHQNAAPPKPSPAMFSKLLSLKSLFSSNPLLSLSSLSHMRRLFLSLSCLILSSSLSRSSSSLSFLWCGSISTGDTAEGSILPPGMMGGMVFIRLCASVGRWGGIFTLRPRPRAAGPVGGLNGLEEEDKDAEGEAPATGDAVAVEDACALGPVGMPPLAGPALGPVGGTVGETDDAPLPGMCRAGPDDQPPPPPLPPPRPAKAPPPLGGT